MLTSRIRRVCVRWKGDDYYQRFLLFLIHEVSLFSVSLWPGRGFGVYHSFLSRVILMVEGRSDRMQYARGTRYQVLAGVLITATSIFLVLDQCGKGWAFASWRQPPGPQEILPGLFAGAQGRNNGGMLSTEGSGSAAITWVFTTIAFILLGMVLRWAVVLDRDRWRMIDAVAGGLLLAGILGNQLDRLILGHVRDYMVLARYPHQIFNTADIFMLLGAVMLMGSLLTNRRMFTPISATT